MKIERLISIITILLERKKISANELAKMFDVSIRTIYRDIETLNLSGIPIITYPGTNGGIGIMEGYKLDKKIFTKSDMVNILIGMNNIESSLLDKEFVNTFERVKSLIPKEHMEQIESKSNEVKIDNTLWRRNNIIQPDIKEIKKAIENNTLMSFKYCDRYAKESLREVEPYQLVLKEGYWYLQAYCLDRNDFRTFKLVRVSEVKISEKVFSKREFVSKKMDGSGWIDDKIINIKLLVDKSLKETMIERCGLENIRESDNNKLIVDFPFVESELGYRLLLSYGDKCECLSPMNVRENLICKINKMLDIYKK
ncbi:helix-turn-helix transcriptional regulator [[Clostridium] dakarense]|uniref:helix-turn-helix transcriptional regulator n=1 Tax=Faecalimicrobium dakarense TaxID=1301100 RepID=UPI0004ACB2AA|nr:YafY family protein [[Clostridium] dakarense]